MTRGAVRQMGAFAKTVFLIDVDNTLLNNDRVGDDLKRFLTREVGADRQERYWLIFEELRQQLGYADYLGALQRYRVENPHEPHLFEVSTFFINYPFANRLYPCSLDVVEHLDRFGTTVLLTDGDVVFQPQKIERSGLLEAVDGRVLLFIHKETELPHIEKAFPADHYVMIDDKIRILTAAKRIWGSRLTTVFVRQGHYALAPDVANYPPADIAVGRIDEVLNFDLPMLLAAGRKG
jgi:FMN phosphatase YigB (HAD superfamily)